MALNVEGYRCQTSDAPENAYRCNPTRLPAQPKRAVREHGAGLVFPSPISASLRRG
jgi:hypothetical protein